MRNSNGSARRNFFRSSSRRLRVGAGSGPAASGQSGAGPQTGTGTGGQQSLIVGQNGGLVGGGRAAATTGKLEGKPAVSKQRNAAGNAQASAAGATSASGGAAPNGSSNSGSNSTGGASTGKGGPHNRNQLEQQGTGQPDQLMAEQLAANCLAEGAASSPLNSGDFEQRANTNTANSSPAGSEGAFTYFSGEFPLSFALFCFILLYFFAFFRLFSVLFGLLEPDLHSAWRAPNMRVQTCGRPLLPAVPRHFRLRELFLFLLQHSSALTHWGQHQKGHQKGRRKRRKQWRATIVIDLAPL